METNLLFNEPYSKLAHDNYPLLLGASKYCPKQLFCKGTLPTNDKIGIAMVGTRRPSASAEELCRRLVESLRSTNAVVISGLAQGIDSFCHRAALDAGGALLSEYEGDTPAYKGNFIARNRIISGLSQSTLVVQSRKKGGALLTAQFCLDEGKLLLACPGNFDSELYSGTNALLDSGHAKPVFAPESLRSVAGIPLLKGTSVQQLATCGVHLSDGAQKVFERFNGFRKTFSELQQEFDFKAPELLAILTELEISGLVSSKDNFQFYFNGA